MKIYIFNTIAISISMTDIEISLKIILLLCTIIYTVKKIIEKNKKLLANTSQKRRQLNQSPQCA